MANRKIYFLPGPKGSSIGNLWIHEYEGDFPQLSFEDKMKNCKAYQAFTLQELTRLLEAANRRKEVEFQVGQSFIAWRGTNG